MSNGNQTATGLLQVAKQPFVIIWSSVRSRYPAPFFSLLILSLGFFLPLHKQIFTLVFVIHFWKFDPAARDVAL